MIFIADLTPPPALCPHINGSAVLKSDDKLSIKTKCQRYEHNNSHLKFILDNTIFVWLSWFEINWLFCFCCFSVPKINVQIGTEQELEKVDDLT